MRFGAIIIGDEILSGKRQDGHLAQVIRTLGARGLALGWAQYLGDDPDHITQTLRRTFGSGDVVFSFGGIGATPDDHTRQCAADAAGVPLCLHPDAEREIRGRWGAEATPQRLAMGEFPQGCAIIPNPFNRIPGFRFHDHYFVPGFPQMAWPMVEWVLDTTYVHLFARGAVGEASIIVRGGGESQIIDLMQACGGTFPRLKVFSLPRMDPGNHFIELGVRGATEDVEPALAVLKAGIEALGFRWEPVAGPG